MELEVVEREEEMTLNKLGGLILGFMLVVFYNACFYVVTFQSNINNSTMLNLISVLGLILLLILFWVKSKPLFTGALICAILLIVGSWVVRAFYVKMYKTSEKKANTTLVPK